MKATTWRMSTVPGIWKAVVGLMVIDIVLLLALLAAPSFAMIRRIYNFNTLYLPILLLSLAVVDLCIWRWARHWCRTLRRAIVLCMVAALLGGLRIYATHIEPHRLQVRKVVLETDKLDQPLRILHISDIQSAHVGQYEGRAFAKMRELKPDLVLFTGDLLQVTPPENTADELRKLAPLFESLAPRYGCYRVLGDVDWDTNKAASAELGGLVTLEDSAAAIPVGNDLIRILGLRRSGSRRADIGLGVMEKWLSESGPGDFTIVLGHAPDYAMEAMKLPLDLCLAGHTHGGQVRIPFIGPIITMSDVPGEWARGFRRIRQAHLNVSAGVGSEHKDAVPPIRVACPPEMTLIEVVPSAKLKGGKR